MKILELLTILLLVSCVGGGGGGGDAKNDTKSSLSSSNPTVDLVADFQENEEDLDAVNQVLESMDDEVEIKSYTNQDHHYSVQLSSVQNNEATPYVYLFNYGLESFKIYSLNIQTGVLETQTFSSKSPRVRSHFHHNGELRYLTDAPLTLTQVTKDGLNHFVVPGLDAKAKLKKVTKLNDNLCLYNNQNQIVAYNLNDQRLSVFPYTGTLQNLYCHDQRVIVLEKTDTQFVLKMKTTQGDRVLDTATLANSEKINLLVRNGMMYYQKIFSLTGTKEHYELLSGQRVTRIPVANVPAPAFVAKLSFYETEKEQSAFKLSIHDKKSKSAVQAHDITDATTIPVKYSNIVPHDEDVFVTTSSQINLYKVEDQGLQKLGNPLGLNINSMVVHNEQLLLGANGRYVLSWNHEEPFTFGHEDFLFKGREDTSHNPKVIERISFDYAQLQVNDEQLEYLKKDQLDNGKLVELDQGKVYITDRYLYFQKGNDDAILLLTFRGKHFKRIWKTPNGKILVVNDGKLLLLDAEESESKALYQFDMNQLLSFRKLVLVDNKLFLIDRNFNLYQVIVPKHFVIL